MLIHDTSCFVPSLWDAAQMTNVVKWNPLPVEKRPGTNCEATQSGVSTKTGEHELHLLR
jgi:hypothetical protein